MADPKKVKAGSNELTAQNLKSVLWETLQGLKNGTMECGNADAIASQAREILRTTKIQLQISSASKREIPIDVLNFNENVKVA